jgi:hypothetical protein
MWYYDTPAWAWLIYIGILVGLAFIPATIARNKGYSYGGFWAFGFFFFVIALIVSLCISDKTYPQYYRPPYQQPYQPYGQPYQQPYQPYGQPYQQQTAQAACPNCGNSVSGDSAFCPKCGTKIK